MLKRIFFILISIAVISCGSGPTLKDPVSNNTATESGGTLWTSSYFSGRVQLDKEFEFIGSQDKSNQSAFRKYYVWQKDIDTFITIVDFKAKGVWSFPKTDDGHIQTSVSDPNLLAYEPDEYSLWKKLHPNSEKVLLELGQAFPMCYAAFQKVKMSPSRSAAFFIIYVEKTGCDYQSYGGIGTRFNNAVSM
jgi:hypothetical protein